MLKADPLTERSPAWWLTLTVMAVGCAMTASVLRTWLSDRAWASAFLSPQTWERLAAWLGRKPVTGDQVDLLYGPFLGAAAAVTVCALLAALVLKWAFGGRSPKQNPNAASPPFLNPQPSTLNLLRRWGFYGWLWWCALGLWEWLWIAAAGSGWTGAAVLLSASIPFWTAVCLAGWLSTLAVSGTESAGGLVDFSARRAAYRKRLWLMIAAYVAVFVTLNWRLWFNLFIPHGDSAMYEEHLWNVLHGKGFRSYLDQGLFLGEHIQVVHLGLLPLYVFWPSHLLLELCESVALALGVFPVAWMTRRHVMAEGIGLSAKGQSADGASSPSLNPQPSTLSRTAVACAAAYLLYFPMQFLDIEIDLKTFRPEAFGIPILLLTLDQLDRRNWRGFLLGVLGCLTVKEDYALVLGPLGLWIAFSREPRAAHEVSGSHLGRLLRARLVLGLSLAVFSVFYLWLATRVIMPWFRSGEEIHYVRYFSELGDTPEAIVKNALTNPGLILGKLLNVHTFVYALSLLVPVAGIALLSPGRLAVGFPLFSVLCLNELARDPRHQFHAPLVAIVFWATAAGLGVLAKGAGPRAKGQQSPSPSLSPQPSALSRAAHILWTCAFTTGLFFSLSPLGLAFWDPGSNWNWWKLYGPTRRGSEFAKVAPQIPKSARVASTDFVHPRFTHYDRSYDYSDYRRKISGYERRVPDDSDYIVIDTTHPYSRYHRPEDVPEFHQLDQWELVTDVTDGYFIVLRRKR